MADPIVNKKLITDKPATNVTTSPIKKDEKKAIDASNIHTNPAKSVDPSGVSVLTDTGKVQGSDNIFSSNYKFTLQPSKNETETTAPKTEGAESTADIQIFGGNDKFSLSNKNNDSIFGNNKDNADSDDEYGGMLSLKTNSTLAKADTTVASSGGGGGGGDSVAKLKEEQEKLEKLNSGSSLKKAFKANKLKKQGEKVEEAGKEVEQEKGAEAEKGQNDANKTQSKANSEASKAGSKATQSSQKADDKTKSLNKGAGNTQDTENAKNKTQMGEAISKKEQEIKGDGAEGAAENKAPGGNSPEANKAENSAKPVDANSIASAKGDLNKFSPLATQEAQGKAQAAQGTETKNQGEAVTQVANGILGAAQMVQTLGQTVKVAGQATKVLGQGLEVIGEGIKKIGDACGCIPYVGPALKAALNAVGEVVKQGGTLLKDTVAPALEQIGDKLNFTGEKLNTQGEQKLAEGTNLTKTGTQQIAQGTQTLTKGIQGGLTLTQQIQEKIGEDNKGQKSGSGLSTTNQAVGMVGNGANFIKNIC
ncbi:MAG: hypothetical protein PHX18_06830 [Candidatus Gastranaerophilales bacterium]|nr:hypothetical protein [Candidatus Gastranaerophilales bacterium]